MERRGYTQTYQTGGMGEGLVGWGGGWDLESRDLGALLWGLWLKPPPLPSPLLLQVLGVGSFPLRPSLTPKPSPRS